MYYTYMIRCKDNSIYTGITTDIERRMNEHSAQDGKGAKYTASHTIEKVEKVWETSNRSLASKLEYNLKKLSKREKESLISNESKLEYFFSEKLECNKYVEIKNINRKE